MLLDVKRDAAKLHEADAYSRRIRDGSASRTDKLLMESAAQTLKIVRPTIPPRKTKKFSYVDF